MKKRVNLVRPYFVTILLLTVAGILGTTAVYGMTGLRFIGMVIAVLACSVLNLMYFIPLKNLFLRLVLPGGISVLLFIWVNQGSSVERNFFTSFGIMNLLIGVIWFLVKRKES